MHLQDVLRVAVVKRLCTPGADEASTEAKRKTRNKAYGTAIMTRALRLLQQFPHFTTVEKFQTNGTVHNLNKGKSD